MSNMIDIWLSMNSCVRDKNDNIFYIESEKKPKLLGRISKYNVEDNTLNIDVVVKKPINFISINVRLTEEGAEIVE